MLHATPISQQAREIIRKFMETSPAKKTTVRIAVIDSDPLRFLGFRALLSSETDFELRAVSLAEIGTNQEVDVGLLGSHSGRNILEMLTTLKALCPRLDVIVTGCNMDEAAILAAIVAGAKGCVDEAASVGELVRAIRIVQAGSVWAPRRVLAMFVEQAYRSSACGVSVGHRPFTRREKEVLRMLVAGCSNKEIAAPLGIEERTVKAHVAKLMRKVGVPNRVLLSVHVITHSLVASREELLGAALQTGQQAAITGQLI
jgi:DNA-binding NarL/FixJ family response regulator